MISFVIKNHPEFAAMKILRLFARSIEQMVHPYPLSPEPNDVKLREVYSTDVAKHAVMDRIRKR
jgi:hypothetical protein